MSKTLVTHINPHLDDIAAIWLFQKYNPEFKDSKVEFISATNDTLVDNEDIVHLGVGRSSFDEHKGDKEDSAASLVYKYLRANGFIKDNEALERLVEWVRIDDLGKLNIHDYPDFSIPSWIRTTDSRPQSSLETVELGKEILERILRVLEQKTNAEKEWEDRVEFESAYGRSYAIRGRAVDRAFCREKGGDLFLMYDPESKWVQYFTPSFDIDLEPIYHNVKSLDSSADWFLHQSHHMVICGSSAAPESKVTKLTFEQLMQAAK